MLKITGFELRKIIGRHGSFYGVIGFSLFVAVLVTIFGTNQDAETWNNALGIPMVFSATILGALAGSYDAAQGTMRYLVLTGEPRWKLVATRVPALFITIALVMLPASILAVICMSGNHQSGQVILDIVLGTYLGSVTWAIVSMAVGTLLRSNGAGIAVALVLFFVGSLLTQLVRDQISQHVGDYLLPNVSNVVSTLGHTFGADNGPTITIGLASALFATVLWLIAIVGLAVLRVQRDEY